MTTHTFTAPASSAHAGRQLELETLTDDTLLVRVTQGSSHLVVGTTRLDPSDAAPLALAALTATGTEPGDIARGPGPWTVCGSVGVGDDDSTQNLRQRAANLLALLAHREAADRAEAAAKETSRHSIAGLGVGSVVFARRSLVALLCSEPDRWTRVDDEMPALGDGMTSEETEACYGADQLVVRHAVPAETPKPEPTPPRHAPGTWVRLVEPGPVVNRAGFRAGDVVEVVRYDDDAPDAIVRTAHGDEGWASVRPLYVKDDVVNAGDPEPNDDTVLVDVDGRHRAYRFGRWASRAADGLGYSTGTRWGTPEMALPWTVLSVGDGG